MTGQALATYFLGQGDDFSWRKGMKIAGCASNLEPRKDQERPYRAHRYCQDRFCPSCGWWKSEQLKKRFESVRPAIEEDYQDFQWVYVTLTLTPCPTEKLEEEIKAVSESFPRLMKRMKVRELEVLGYYRFTELDRFSEEESRVHLHAVLLIPEEGMDLITECWIAGLWRESMNLNYSPRVQIDRKDEKRSVSDWIGYSSKPMVGPGDELDGKYMEWMVRVAPCVHGKHTYVSGGVIRSYLSRAKNQEKVVSDTESVELEMFSPVGVNELVMWMPLQERRLTHNINKNVPLGDLLEVLDGGHECSAENKQAND